MFSQVIGTRDESTTVQKSIEDEMIVVGIKKKATDDGLGSRNCPQWYYIILVILHKPFGK